MTQTSVIPHTPQHRGNPTTIYNPSLKKGINTPTGLHETSPPVILLSLVSISWSSTAAEHKTVASKILREGQHPREERPWRGRKCRSLQVGDLDLAMSAMRAPWGLTELAGVWVKGFFPKTVWSDQHSSGPTTSSPRLLELHLSYVQRLFANTL